MSEEEIGDRDREKEYTYTYVRRRTDDYDSNYRRKNRCQKVTLYYPARRRDLIEQAKQLFKREGQSISQYFLDQLESYIRLHEPGNPQQRLDTILRLGKAYHAPSPICGFKDCMRDVVTVAIFVQNKKEYGLCEKHKKEAEELGRKVWRFLSK